MSLEAWGDENPDYGAFDAAIEAGWIDPTDLSKALIDVMNERDRHQNEEGWTPEHDDAHDKGELAVAAACYATNAGVASRFVGNGSIPADKIDAVVSRCEMPPGWPWAWKWWKPKGRRRDLVRAASLILAEIERLDRAEAKAKAGGAA